jgi:hypothetical protein
LRANQGNRLLVKADELFPAKPLAFVGDGAIRKVAASIENCQSGFDQWKARHDIGAVDGRTNVSFEWSLKATARSAWPKMRDIRYAIEGDLTVKLSVNLASLSFGCYVYRFLGGDIDDGGYMNLPQPLNLKLREHRDSLLKWLNGWGCRQFKITDHPVASEELDAWSSEYDSRFFARENGLFSLTEDDFITVEHAFDDLAARKASTRKVATSERGCSVRFGPVGTAKTLFALRPNALPPWDTPIYSYFGWQGSGAGYVEYLREASGCLSQIAEECTARGVRLEDLPNRLCRPNSTPVKLIDEYLWVTITNRVPIPSKEKFEEWLDWSTLRLC